MKNIIFVMTLVMSEFYMISIKAKKTNQGTNVLENNFEANYLFIEQITKPNSIKNFLSRILASF